MSEIKADPHHESRLIVRPNEVKGFQTTAEAKPNRYFYILCGDECWECDGYRTGDPALPDDHSDVRWAILLTCPVCHQSLKLDSTKKKLSVGRFTGLESAEPIRCPYPAQFSGPCPFVAVLEPPRKQEEKEISVRVDGNVTKRIAVDAVAKRA
jgi:uncharacterized protein YbaR (Trm112 family)